MHSLIHNCPFSCIVLPYLTTLIKLSVRLLITMHILAMQAGASVLQQELQGLRCSAAQTEKQLQGDITSLQGQLETALSDSDQEISSLRGRLGTALDHSGRQMDALKNQLKVAAADSARRLSVMKGELETAQAECAKASQVEERPSRTAGIAISRGRQPSRHGVLLRYTHSLQPSPSVIWQSTTCCVPLSGNV